MSREGEALAVVRGMAAASLRSVLDQAAGPAPDDAAERADLVASAVGFCRTLRAAGSPVTVERAQRFVESLAALDHRDHAAVYWSGRLTLCADPDDLVRSAARPRRLRLRPGLRRRHQRPGRPARPPRRARAAARLRRRVPGPHRRCDRLPADQRRARLRRRARRGGALRPVGGGAVD